MEPAERGEELLELYRSLETERRAIEVRYLKDQIRLLAADPRCLCQPAPADSEQAGECNSLPQHMLPTRTDVDDLGVTYAEYGGDAPLSDELADLMVKLAVGLRAEGISRAGFPTRYAWRHTGPGTTAGHHRGRDEPSRIHGTGDDTNRHRTA